jgi:DNA-binding transcriptional LysR family regulator
MIPGSWNILPRSRVSAKIGGVTQSTLSAGIRQMEASPGVPLVEPKNGS